MFDIQIIRGGRNMYRDGYDEDEDAITHTVPDMQGGVWEAQSTSAEYGVEGHPAGAPAERVDAPVPERIVTTPRRFATYNFERKFAPRTDEWSEPSYSQARETTPDMYTPGIYANDPHSRWRETDVESEDKTRRRSGRFGGFMRVACLILACVVLSGAGAFGVVEYRFSRGDFNVVNQVILGGSSYEQNNSGLSAPVSTNGMGMSAEDIYTMACTQVVGITTKAETSGSGGMIFGYPSQGSAIAVAGSGFIVSSDGYILTNYHVVETSYINDLPLMVRTNDGTEYEAEVVGYEASNDVALIRIAATGLNPAVIANSDNINVGQAVYAVGNPLGELTYTMTEGIVSARNREVSVEGKTINTFQFSAAVNSGNSGGPLYDTSGEVIGIVTAKPMSSAVEGIGFAIPINDAIDIAAELIEFGYITGRPLMGITADTVSRAHAEYYGWGVVGVYVITVSQDSAAEKAGLLVGDIIIGLGESEIDSMETLRFAMRKYKAGETATLTVWRSGESVELSITFDEDLSAGQVRSVQPETQEKEQIIETPDFVPREEAPAEINPSLRPPEPYPSEKPTEMPEEFPAP